ncbi:hypothetical protein Dimus_016327, partial [Dionaea muscipula]
GCWPDLGDSDPLTVTRHIAGNDELMKPGQVLKRKISDGYQKLFTFVYRNILPRGEGRSKANFLDLTLIHLLDKECPINLPSLMIKRMNRAISTTEPNRVAMQASVSLLVGSNKISNPKGIIRNVS